MLSAMPFPMPSRFAGLLLATMLPIAALATAQDSAVEAGAPAAVASAPVTTQAEVETPGVSQVRIVRLSQVRGATQMDRNTGRGFEPAFANIPVIAGAQLRTAEGIAEVEFEDNSSLRVAPQSEVRFAELSRTAAGDTVTVVEVRKGMAYVDVGKSKANRFKVTEGTAQMTLMPGTHVRLDATRPDAELAVFDGSVELQTNGTVATVSKHQTLGFNPTAETVSASRHGVDEVAWDAWDKQETGYHRQRAGLAGSGGFGLYGANDLNYYGSFVNMPGCGSLWRPYFASTAWDPFANGVWAWYPTAGYSWVSPYPWGWLPFHSGSWVSCGGAGWGWQPGGGQWYGLSNTVAMRIARHPIQTLPAPPTRNLPALVPVNMKMLPVSGGSTQQAFTFRRDSAGLGVPRSTFGSLHGASSTVERQGTATSTRASAAGYVAPGAGVSREMAGTQPTAAGPARPGTHGTTTLAPSAPSAGMRSAPSSSAGGSAGMSSGGSAHGGSHK